MKDLILLATTKELKLIEKLNLNNDYDVKIMGVGAFNVFKTLSNINLTEYRKVYNIGYAGGKNIGETSKVELILNRGHIDNKDIFLEIFDLEDYTISHEALQMRKDTKKYQNYKIRQNKIHCHTGDFFHVGEIEDYIVYDMELWYIAKYLDTTDEFKKLIAYKVISDNGDMKEYEENSN